MAIKKPRFWPCALNCTSARNCLGSSKRSAYPVAVMWKALGSVMSKSVNSMCCILPLTAPRRVSDSLGQRSRKAWGIVAIKGIRSFLLTWAFMRRLNDSVAIGFIRSNGISISTSISESGVFKRNFGRRRLPFSITTGPVRSVICNPLFSFKATLRNCRRSVGSW